jgi:hypothetical protein
MSFKERVEFLPSFRGLNKLSEKQYFALLYYLHEAIFSHFYKRSDPDEIRLVIIEEMRISGCKVWPKLAIKYLWKETYCEMKTKKTTYEKIAFLKERERDFHNEFVMLLFEPDHTFPRSIKEEIEYLERLPDADIPPATAQNSGYISGLRISKGRGTKVNLIRVLNALHDLHLFEIENGDRPTKDAMFAAFDQFLGGDIGDYSPDLSQALNVSSHEANMSIFDQMKAKTMDAILDAEKKKKNMT